MHRSIALGVIVLLAGCATAPTTITPVKPMFGEHGFVNELVWRRISAHNDADKYGPIHDLRFARI